MKTFIYPRLAWDGIKKNRRMVFPYILTCICMISMFYILMFLSSPGTVELLPRGGDTATIILTLGSFVIAVFSVIFLYYTNSFLIRRRAAEFGLYNVLGMAKRDLIKIISFETLITSAVSIVAGLSVGISLSKLAELGLLRIIGGTITYKLRVDMTCVIFTVLFYIAIFAVIWLSSIIRVGSSSTVSLLKSEKTGEKPPKANWLLGILGTVILAAAYYIAVSINNPIEALLWFFLAVILVIIATYLLMISGSVLFCRMLQKNKKYYYDPKHFVSVSSMVYRMKRNGAGLASIAIMATMVLVMISSASSLWFGTRDMLKNRYPGEVNLTVRFYKSELFNDEYLDNFRKIIDHFRIENTAETETNLDISYVQTDGIGQENSVDFGQDFNDTMNINKIREVCFIPLAVYNRQTGQNINLKPDEAIAYSSGCSIDSDSLDLINEGRVKNYRLVKGDDTEFYADKYLKNLVPQIYLIVSDIDETVTVLKDPQEDDHSFASYIWKFSIDVTQTSMSKDDYANALTQAIMDNIDSHQDNTRFFSIITEERETESVFYLSSNGSLFFIGIVLSAVFIFAAVLIIYYKQISEGYEDSRRFEVMRKVGMTKQEIKKNINSQLLVVFFIPLIFAGMHLTFAFPMIEKLLSVFGLTNKVLFIITTLISYVIFALFYTIVYRVTSNEYYNIVSEAK